jgi:hypothetical protein
MASDWNFGIHFVPGMSMINDQEIVDSKSNM